MNWQEEVNRMAGKNLSVRTLNEDFNPHISSLSNIAEPQHLIKAAVVKDCDDLAQEAEKSKKTLDRLSLSFRSIV